MLFVYCAVMGQPSAGADSPAVTRRVDEAEAGFGRPAWIPLALDGRAGEGSIPELFRSNEVVQMYHIQVLL